jgi:hypothetical protein
MGKEEDSDVFTPFEGIGNSRLDCETRRLDLES